MAEVTSKKWWKNKGSALGKKLKSKGKGKGGVPKSVSLGKHPSDRSTGSSSKSETTAPETPPRTPDRSRGSGDDNQFLLTKHEEISQLSQESDRSKGSNRSDGNRGETNGNPEAIMEELNELAVAATLTRIATRSFNADREAEKNMLADAVGLPADDDEETHKMKGTSKKKDISAWKSAFDASTGKSYWYNHSTGEVSWNAPGSSAATDSASETDDSNIVRPKRSPSSAKYWQRATDPKSGESYWINKKTRETSWDRPSSLVAASDASNSLADEEKDDEAQADSLFLKVPLAKELVRSFRDVTSCRDITCADLNPTATKGISHTFSGDDYTDRDYSTIQTNDDETGDNYTYDEEATYDEEGTIDTFDNNDIASAAFDDGRSFRHVPFKQLPDDVLTAALTLGYTKEMWNKSYLAPTEYLEWQELTADQKKAARKLGYNQGRWQKKGDDSVTDGSTDNCSSKQDGETLSLSGSMFDDLDCKGFPKVQRKRRGKRQDDIKDGKFSGFCYCYPLLDDDDGDDDDDDDDE